MIKVKDIAYVRFAAPDLDAMERFLTAFGLVISTRHGDRLYARGTAQPRQRPPALGRAAAGRGRPRLYQSTP